MTKQAHHYTTILTEN